MVGELKKSVEKLWNYMYHLDIYRYQNLDNLEQYNCSNCVILQCKLWQNVNKLKITS